MRLARFPGFFRSQKRYAMRRVHPNGLFRPHPEIRTLVNRVSASFARFSERVVTVEHVATGEFFRRKLASARALDWARRMARG